MKNIFYFFAVTLICSTVIFAQKGIDTQTEKIKKEGTKITSQTNQPVSPSNRSFDWGKGKTKVRPPLANPYRMNARRDILIGNIIEILKDQKIVVDESTSRLKDGIIITAPYLFAKGPLVAQNELSHYAVLPSSDTAWTRGRYTLTIEVQTIDGIQNNVSVTAKVEGRSANGLQSEWTTLQSSGEAEDNFLVKLVEMVTGVSPDEQPDSDQ